MNASLGTKRICPQCGAKFYDLGAAEVTCPKCAFIFPDVSVKAKSAPAVDEPKPEPKRNGHTIPEDDEDGEMEGMGKVVELEELDDFDDEDIDHLEEVEDHHEDPEVDVNSDDADDEMFIDDLAENGLYIIDDLDEGEFEEREAL